MFEVLILVRATGRFILLLPQSFTIEIRRFKCCETPRRTTAQNGKKSIDFFSTSMTKIEWNGVER